MTRPRIAVVGAGWWAANHHIPALAAYDGVELAGLCDPVRSRAADLARLHGIPVVADGLDELLASSQLDGVVIATPHSTHHRLARTALDAGVHVLVEKTMTTTAADAFDLVATAEKAGLHLSVGYTYQYTSTAEFARRSVQEQIGDLVQVSAEFSSTAGMLFAAAGDGDEGEVAHTPHPVTYSAQLGGGQAHTQLTHVMGMLCWATGREVEEVMAFVDRRGLDVDVDDVAAFRFVGGGTGVVASTGMAPVPDGRRTARYLDLDPISGVRHGIRYLGMRGIVDHDMLTGRVELYRDDGSTAVRTPPTTEPGYPTQAPARAFADLIAGRGPNRAPGRPAAAAVAFIEALLDSASARCVASVRRLPPARG